VQHKECQAGWRQGGCSAPDEDRRGQDDIFRAGGKISHRSSDEQELGVVAVVAQQLHDGKDVANERAARTARQTGPIRLKAQAFKPESDIPAHFTCDGSNLSPALTWTAPPAGAQSFALVMEDPDAPAGTWIHWVAYDLPATERGLPEGIEPTGMLSSGMKQGQNDFGRIGYGGPCPPPGSAHRYWFRLFALDTKLGLKPGATRAQLEHAMRGHVLAQTDMMARYRRAS